MASGLCFAFLLRTFHASLKWEKEIDSELWLLYLLSEPLCYAIIEAHIDRVKSTH